MVFIHCLAALVQAVCPAPIGAGTQSFVGVAVPMGSSPLRRQLNDGFDEENQRFRGNFSLN